MTITVMSLNQKSEKKTSIQSEAYRNSVTILRNLRKELRGASTSLELADGVSNTLEYRIPEWSDDRLIVDNRGRPIWKAEHQIEVRTDGSVVRSKTGSTETKLIGKLGTGQLEFEMKNSQILSIQVDVELSETSTSQTEVGKASANILLNIPSSPLWQNTSVFEAF